MRWDSKKIGDLVTIRTGKLDANAMVIDGKYPFFTCSREIFKIDSFAFDTKAVLLAGNNASGDFNVKYYEGRFNAYQRTYVITIDDESKLIYPFLKHKLETHLKVLKNQAIGANTRFLKIGMIKDIKIPLPTLSEQKRIAAILDEADCLRQKDKQRIEKYNQLSQSVFLEMFGDPVSNPKGWEVKQLKDISTKILSGNTPKGGSDVYIKDGIPFFRSQNVWKNNLVFDNIAYIDNIIHNRMRNSSLKNGDILMTKTGRVNTENSSLGRAAMFLGEDDSANINGHVYLIRLGKDIINKFVLFILTTNSYRDHIRRVCVGGIDKRQINKEHLEEFPIISPPIDLQNKFTSIITEIDRHKKQTQKSLVKSEDLFNSLLQRAFKGEL